MKINVLAMLIVSGLSFVLFGCQVEQDSPEVVVVPDKVSDKETSTQVADKEFKSRVQDKSSQVKKAIDDLATRLDVPLHSIKTVRVESVTWQDGSLGCPKKGMSYTQALVPGTLIVLRADNADYEYHSGSGRDPFYCTNPQPPASATTAE